MQRDGHDNANFFVGTEVERSPAYGLKTLFVVGIQDPATVVGMAQRNNCEHIYFGANHSFPALNINDSDGWKPWEAMVKFALDSNAWVTLDFDVNQTEGVIESCFVEYDRFIPMISVKLPYLRQLGYNATLKLDDKDFEATNPGVWCHSLHELTNRTAFTDWSKYSQDTLV